MEPGDLYVLGIVMTALLVAPFDAMARVIVLSWIVAHVGFSVGLAEQWANLGGQVCVFVIGARHLRSAPALIAWAFSIPLILINGAWLLHLVPAWTAWWSVLTVAMLQLLALPLAISGDTQRAVSRAWYETTGYGLLKTGATR